MDLTINFKEEMERLIELMERMDESEVLRQEKLMFVSFRFTLCPVCRDRIAGELAKTWRGGETVTTAEVDYRPAQFLYRQGDDYVFMDLTSYDQTTLDGARVGDAAGYLIENVEVKTVLFQERVIALNLPMTVDLTVQDTTPALKGATAQAQLKPATVETGLQVLVPPYIEAGEKIRVDTRDGRFVERAK